MNVTELLHFVDQIVFKDTDKHLDDLQLKIVQGLLNGQTYEEISQDLGYNDGHIGDVSRKLYKILSKHLGEDINKLNFTWTIERVINSKFVDFRHNNINYCSNNTNENLQEIEKEITNKIYKDLTFAPKIVDFYNRTTEIETLSNWIFQDNISLISILGMSGIGKTALVKKFVDLNLEQFSVIIWHSLQFPKPLELLVDDLLNVCEVEYTGTLDNKLKKIFDILTKKKCLIILDDLHNIFTNGQLAGQYQTEYQTYQKFFRMIVELEHQSSLILISREQSGEMECLDDQLYLMKCLDLFGLDDVQILEKFALKGENNLLDLINLYEGNPSFLKEVTILIKDIFDGDANQFLAENSLIITKNMQFHFHQLFQRLSSIEQQLVLHLSKSEQPVIRDTIKENLKLSSTDLINGLKSLQQRYLVKKNIGESVTFQLSKVFHQYIKDIYSM